MRKLVMNIAAGLAALTDTFLFVSDKRPVPGGPQTSRRPTSRLLAARLIKEISLSNYSGTDASSMAQ